MSIKLWRMLSVLRRYQRTIERGRSPEDMIKEFKAASEISEKEPMGTREFATEWPSTEQRRRRLH